MIYIVLREPTSSGFVNRLAFSDNDTVEVISCGGSTIATQKGRLSEIGELANEINISQAQGAVAQGVEGSLAIVDWDGAARVSAEIYAGTKRFYGWSLAVARSDSPTTTPDWLWGDPDHCMVTDISTDGGTIGLTYGERWANDGRLLSFDGAPLIVGNHQTYVKTPPLTSPNVIKYTCNYGHLQGNPKSPLSASTEEQFAGSKQMILAVNPNTGAQESVPAFLFKAQLNADANAFLYATKFPPTGSDPVILQGRDHSFHWKYGESTTHFQYDPIDSAHSFVWIQVPIEFYNAENPEDVFFYQGLNAFSAAAGASALIGFGSGKRSILPAGETTISNRVLRFAPNTPILDGFVAYSLLPARVTWILGSDSGQISGSSVRVKYLNGTDSIKTDGDKSVNWATLSGDLTPSNSDAFAVWLSLGGNGGQAYRTFNLSFWFDLIDAVESGESYTSYSSSMNARIDALGNTVSLKIPFKGSDNFNFTDYIYQENSPKLFNIAANSSQYRNDIQALNGIGNLKVDCYETGVDVQAYVCLQFSELSLYGKTIFKNGESYALIKPGPSPIDGSYATSQGLWQAAAAILVYAPYSTYLTPFLPSFVPAPADSGECMDASKTYVENAETLAKETWAVFGWLDGGYISPGYDNQSAQGLGEIPQPPTLQIGRFEDVITEPVVEYCDVAGTLTKKAYIANVDQEYDATNSGKFFGGWGHEPLPETIQSDFLYYRWDVCPIRLGPMPASPDGTYGSWYYETLHGNTIWQSAKDYGYQIWQRCRAAWKVHHIKRGSTFQFRGIYDDSVIGAMWWDSQRNGARRIDWLCLQPRYLTFSVREAKPLCWAGASVYIPGTLAAFAGYDVSDWDQGGGDTLICVKKAYSLTTGKATYTVAIPPVGTTSDIPIYRDTLDATHAIGKLVDTLDATATISKYTDTLEG